MAAPECFEALDIPHACVEKRSSCKENQRSFSINPASGDEIWRIKVDGCWLRGAQKRVDYIFWVQSKSGKRAIILVELKGSNYGQALDQIESTLRLLCKRSSTNFVHTGKRPLSPGHDGITDRGVQAYVVLSTGRQASKTVTRRGRKIPQRLSRLERIRLKYQVRVQPKTNRMFVRGVDALWK